ncbi:hypothetical protein BS78_05G218000 [Paspalum vaginatum]|nr:hypothetical protein BS78_05G218000 [Paspalum vaginatum]
MLANMISEFLARSSMPAVGRSGGATEPTSASETVVMEVSGSHIVTFTGHSITMKLANDDSIRSSPFTIAGYRWRVVYYPGGRRNSFDSTNSGYVSIYLEVRDCPTGGDDDADDVILARFTISLLDKNGAPVLGYIQSTGGKDKQFASMNGRTDRGFDQFTYWSDSPHHCPTRFIDVPPPTMDEDLGRLPSSGKGSEVVFEVAGETFATHRNILAMRSLVFMAEFFGPMKEMTVNSCCSVRIEDMEAMVFKALLHFVYTDSLPEIDEGVEAMDMSQHLLITAARYGLERLKLVCEDSLCNYIDKSSVSMAVRGSRRHAFSSSCWVTI